jgi:hypothetical protein
MHFPNIASEELSITFPQHLAGRNDRLPMSVIAAGKLDPLIVGQVFAIMNIEEVAWHRSSNPEATARDPKLVHVL